MAKIWIRFKTLIRFRVVENLSGVRMETWCLLQSNSDPPADPMMVSGKNPSMSKKYNLKYTRGPTVQGPIIWSPICQELSLSFFFSKLTFF